MITVEAGWAVAWDQPTFAEARAKAERLARCGLITHLHRTLADAHRIAGAGLIPEDTHKARVFWVVRAR